MCKFPHSREPLQYFSTGQNPNFNLEVSLSLFASILFTDETTCLIPSIGLILIRACQWLSQFQLLHCAPCSHLSRVCGDECPSKLCEECRTSLMATCFWATFYLNSQWVHFILWLLFDITNFACQNHLCKCQKGSSGMVFKLLVSNWKVDFQIH